MSYGDASGGSTRAEQAQAGYVIMFADRALLEGMAAPVTLVSWRSHRVKRVEASASAAEAMGLSEAIAQGDWVRALWSEVVLGLSLPEWHENKKMCHPSFWSLIQRTFTIIYTTKQLAPMRTGGVLLIWQLSEKTYPVHRCTCCGLMERRKLTELHGDGDLLRAGVPSSIHGVGRSTRDYGCQTSRKTRTGKGTESQVTIKVAGACGRNIDACDHNDNRDLT